MTVQWQTSVDDANDEDSSGDDDIKDGQTPARYDQGQTGGRMLDSDGFMIAEMTEDDYQKLTLEEKILCGYFKLSSSPGEPDAEAGKGISART